MVFGVPCELQDTARRHGRLTDGVDYAHFCIIWALPPGRVHILSGGLGELEHGTDAVPVVASMLPAAGMIHVRFHITTNAVLPKCFCR